MELAKSDSWVTEQIKTLGSTAAGIVAGESPYRTPAEHFDAMVAAASGTLPPKKLNPDMRRGLMTEPIHRELLSVELSMEVHDHQQDNFLYNTEYPWAHALPDGWLYPADGEQVPVQLKCPRAKSWYDIKRKGIHGYWLLGTQHSLAVTGAPYEYFSVLNADAFELIHFPVYPDKLLIASLMQIEKDFYTAFTNRERPTEDIPHIDMPQTTGSMVTIDDDEAREAAQFYKECKQMVDDAKELMTEAEEKVKSLMGDAEVMEIPGWRFYNVAQDGRRTIDKQAMARDGLDISKYQKQGNPFRTFRSYNLAR